MKPLYRFIAVALLVLGIFAWWYYRPHRVLERKMDGLISTLNFQPSTSRSARLIKSSSISKYFDAQVEITAPIDEANGNFSPEDLNSAYSFLSENAREITISRTTDITTDIKDDHATQQFQAEAQVSVSRWLKNIDGLYSITVHWRKTEQGWKIHSSHWQQIP